MIHRNYSLFFALAGLAGAVFLTASLQAEYNPASIINKTKETVKKTEAASSQANVTLDQAARTATDLTSLWQGIQTKGSELTKISASNPGLVEAAQGLLSSLGSKQDASALGFVGRMMAAKPTADQMNLIKGLRDDVSVLVLQRNFDASQPGLGGPLQSAVKAIRSGDVAGIIANLSQLTQTAKLTAAQKDLLGSLKKSFQPAAGAVKDAIKSGSVNDLNPFKK